MDNYNHLESWSIVRRLLKEYIAPYKIRIIASIFFMVIAALCSAIIVRLTKPVIDKVLIEHDNALLVLITSVIFVVYIVKGLAEFFQNYLVKFVGQQILTDLQIKMYKHLLYSDYSLITSLSSGRLISRFTNDIVLMRGAVSNTLVGCAKHLLSVVFLIGIMFTLDLYLSLFVFLVFPVAIYPIQRLGRNMRAVVHNSQEELGNFTAKLDESFGAIKVIKSFCAEEVEFKNAKKITNKILEFYERVAKLDSIASPLMEILSGFTIVGLIWYGNYAISTGNMTTGTLFTFIMAFVSAYRPYKSLVSLNVNLQEGLAAANRVFNVLDLKPKIIDQEHAKDNIKFKKPKIEYENVTLSFREGKDVLRDYSLKVEAGKTYAFVGSSGSGKTSVANLIMRLFDPNEGRILIDGHDIRDLTLHSLRNQIAFVAQETMLFDDTVANNIGYGNDGVIEKNMDLILAAAKAANAHEFISALPDGYNTVLGSDGHSLSGGQRQRLSIARAFYKDAPILVLDEATSALDARSETNIINSLRELRKDKTTLIITHRLNSIVHADQIVVMKNGLIVEQGKHNELIARKQEYCKLYNKELQEQEGGV